MGKGLPLGREEGERRDGVSSHGRRNRKGAGGGEKSISSVFHVLHFQIGEGNPTASEQKGEEKGEIACFCFAFLPHVGKVKF